MMDEQEPQGPVSAEGARVALKERLTGAVILVALVVLLVPALLTGRRPEQPDVGTSTSGLSRSYEIDLVGPQRPAAEDPDEPLPEPEPVPVPVPASASPPPVPAAAGAAARPPAVAAKPVRTAPTGVPRISSTVSSGNAVGVAAPRQPPLSHEGRSPQDGPQQPAPGPGDRSAGPAGSPAHTPGAASAGRASGSGAAASAPPAAWAVQLGAFAGREAAARLVATLRAKGYAAFVLEYRRDGKVLYRVRVGPEQDRQRAVAIAARLNREGYRASVAPHP